MVLSVNEIEKYIRDGYEFQAVLPDGKAVMRLKF